MPHCSGILVDSLQHFCKVFTIQIGNGMDERDLCLKLLLLLKLNMSATRDMALRWSTYDTGWSLYSSSKTQSCMGILSGSIGWKLWNEELKFRWMIYSCYAAMISNVSLNLLNIAHDNMTCRSPKPSTYFKNQNDM